MSDLSSMIDDTTERLLRKVDNWEIPQSDKKYVTIEKEVWESTLKASMDRAGKIETLQEQLDIAIWALYSLLTGKKTIKIGKSEELIETYALNKIEELNK